MGASVAAVRLHVREPAAEVHTVTIEINFNAARRLPTRDNPVSKRLHLLTLGIPDDFAERTIRQ